MFHYNIDNDCLKDINENRIRVSMSPIIVGSDYEKHIMSYSVHEANYNEEVEGRNFRKLAKTDFFIYDFLFHSLSDGTYISKVSVPLITFATGEIKDKPGVFLNFNKPETLDDQLAEIYGLTVEEQELMKDSIRPWKDKLSLTADGLY